MNTRDKSINSPGAPTNTPQYLLPEEGSAKARSQKVLQTGEGTASAERDVADPHPSDEEHPYDERHPGGANPPKTDIGPNNAVHNGKVPSRPDNAANGER
jgi:hypothetical protein